MPPNKSTRTDKEVARQVWRYVAPHRGSFAVAVGAFVLASATEPLIPKLLQTALDEGFVKGGGFPLWMVPATLIGLFALRGVLGFIGQYMLHRGLSRSVLGMRRDLAQAVLKADASMYTEVAPGVVVNKLVNDPQTISANTASALITLLRDGTTSVALVGYLLWMNWSLTLLAFLALPLLMWGVSVVQKRMRRMNTALYEAQNRLAAMAEDLARSWRVIRTFDAQAFEAERLNAAAGLVQRAGMKSAAAWAAMTPISQLAASLGVAAIVTLAMMQVRAGEGSVGSFAGYIAALLLLVSRVRHLTDVSQPLMSALVVARGCFELMDTPPEPDHGRTELQTPAAGEISFEAVTVRYRSEAGAALDGVSFQVPRGHTVAIVGASGSGKTTLVNTLLGFVQPEGGRVLLDGRPIDELTRKSLRRQFAVVSQDVVLFNGSLADNVVYALPRDEARLKAALHDAALDAMVADLPQGVDSSIGINGSSLSGGQRQRLSIARALYKDAPVWILDEATSALDSESERVIQQALRRWQGRKTIILIAHRLSTVAHADCIVVMERGRIVEQGTHAQLSAGQGPYARALALQAAPAAAPEDPQTDQALTP